MNKDSSKSRGSLLRPNLVLNKQHNQQQQQSKTFIKPQEKFVVRITNFNGCDNKVNIINLIYSKFTKKIGFIHVSDALDFCFVGLFNKDDANELCSIFDRLAFNHLILESKIINN